MILAHGFLRNPQTMDHLANSLADGGIETACIKLKRSTPFNGNHAENARDLIALRQALGWKTVSYAGFSAGGLSALIAASEDEACRKMLLLDPVDQGSLGKDAASKIRIPTLAILGQPGPGNANRNASVMIAAIPGCRIIEIPTIHNPRSTIYNLQSAIQDHEHQNHHCIRPPALRHSSQRRHHSAVSRRDRIDHHHRLRLACWHLHVWLVHPS